MRGIDTSSTATSGRTRLSRLERRHAVVGLGHHLHVGLALDQHAQARPHDPVVVGDQDADQRGTRSVIVVPPPGAERTSSSPPTSRARSAMPTRPSPLAGVGARHHGGIEAAAVVAHPQLGAAALLLELELDERRAGVARRRS